MKAETPGGRGPPQPSVAARNSVRGAGPKYAKEGRCRCLLSMEGLRRMGLNPKSTDEPWMNRMLRSPRNPPPAGRHPQISSEGIRQKMKTATQA